ncbi:MAG TPA: heparan-alpha-glucosaminide N-acetyltransferase domain-containing protein, partial [Thermoanaerobaculia bacterium]|nr:heparan-alpha-glucosaminide N-acetyltransferase domain-containing protein [Thermoanaerobaculia bacterium]
MDTLQVTDEAQTAATPVPFPAPQARLESLDAFRGLTVAGMLLVNNPGTWSAIYPPLQHAKWHGWTATDLVFPFFLFIVGVTTHLSLRGMSPAQATPKILRRGALIILCGLLLNAFPFFWWGKIPDVPSPTFLERVVWRFEHLRIPGVLQRIGLVYLVAALIAVRSSRRQRVVTIGVILVSYWLLMTLVPVPGTGSIGAFLLDEPSRTLAAWSDRVLLGANHLWASTKTWDPEGPLSTLPAVATALLGVLAGEWIVRREKSLAERIAGLFAVGLLLMAAGSIWGWFFPINKNLWTSSYVLFTAGFAAVVLACCIWLVDHYGVRGWARPFVVYGVNPLVAFVGSGIMARLIGSLIKIPFRGKFVSLQQASYE